MLDKDTTLAEKIRTLFREQGITIASLLTAIGMAIGVLVEALLPGGGGAVASGGEPQPEDEAGLKEWIRNKLKALAGKLVACSHTRILSNGLTLSPVKAKPHKCKLVLSLQAKLKVTC